MLWHIFVVLLSHSLLALVGVMVDHDSLHGDQATVFLFLDRDIFIMLYFVCFLVAGPLELYEVTF